MLTTAGPYCSTSPLKSGSATVGAPLTATVGAAGFAVGTTAASAADGSSAVGSDTAERERAGDGDRDRAAFQDIGLHRFLLGSVRTSIPACIQE